MEKAKWLIWMAGPLMFLSVLNAATIYVPDDYPTIQTAHDNSHGGDTIMVAPGTYEEHLNIGQRVRIKSEAGPEHTFIHGTVYAYYTPLNLSGFSISGYKDGLFGIIHFTAYSTGCLIDHCIITVNEDEVPSEKSWRCLSMGGEFTSTAIVTNCIFSNSHDKQEGSAILAEECQVKIQNNLFINNHSDDFGGAVYLDSCASYLGNGVENNVFIYNSAPVGSAIAVASYPLPIKNNIFVHNESSESSGAIDNFFSGSHPIVSYNAFWNNIGGDTNNCFVGAGNLLCNPAFVSIPNLDFHLQECSPCIDSGHPDDDYSKEQDPNGNRINVGLYGNTPEATSWGLECPTRTPTAAPSQKPTVTPTPSPSPTATATPMDGILLALHLPEEPIHAGDTFYLDVTISNANPDPLTDIPLFVILEAAGTFWYHPAWSMDPAWEMLSIIPAGPLSVPILEAFEWPGNAGTGTARFWGALTDEGMTRVLGNYDVKDFYWE